MTHRPSLKLMETTMTDAELPATRPLLVETDVERISWRRKIKDSEDEKALIEEQKESLRRINAAVRDEAERIHDARVSAAFSAREREFSDADKLMAAGIEALDRRSSDLDRTVAGLTAALGASEK